MVSLANGIMALRKSTIRRRDENGDSSTPRAPFPAASPSGRGAVARRRHPCVCYPGVDCALIRRNPRARRKANVQEETCPFRLAPPLDRCLGRGQSFIVVDGQGEVYVVDQRNVVARSGLRPVLALTALTLAPPKPSKAGERGGTATRTCWR